jgi:phage integrase family site-specific recombinase
VAVSFRRRGKKKLWDYRVFDSQKKVVASNSGFRTKKEAEIEARSVEAKVLKGTVLDKQVTLFSLWEKWFTLSILPQRKSETTLKKYQIRGKKIQEFFQNTPISQIKASKYQEFINHYAQKLSKDSIRRLNADVKKVIQFAKRDKIGIDNFTDGVIITGKVTGKKG